MKSFQVLAVLMLSLTLAITADAADRKEYVSDASFIIGTYQPAMADHSPAGMAKAAKAFIDSLDADQKKKAVHDLKNAERRQWTNLPARPNAGGLTLGEMNEQQVKRACDLFAALSSEQGYRKIIETMLADDQLIKKGRAPRGIGTETFAIVIFGTPDEKEPWGFQFDGHHLAVNAAIEGEKFTISPSFYGMQPLEFVIGDKKYRPFTDEIDAAYELAGSLTDDQKAKAVLSDKNVGLTVGPGADGKLPKKEGIPCSELTSAQQDTLKRIIGRWVNDLPPAHAEARMKQIEGEMDKMHFAYWGGTKAGELNTYRVYSPSLVIEYNCQGVLTHLHTIYRDPTNEYGGQLD